jgi:hypothetical protein
MSRLFHPGEGLLYQSSDVGGADPVTLHDFQNDRLAQEFLKCGFALNGHIRLHTVIAGRSIYANHDDHVAGR